MFINENIRGTEAATTLSLISSQRLSGLVCTLHTVKNAASAVSTDGNLFKNSKGDTEFGSTTTTFNLQDRATALRQQLINASSSVNNLRAQMLASSFPAFSAATSSHVSLNDNMLASTTIKDRGVSVADIRSTKAQIELQACRLKSTKQSEGSRKTEVIAGMSTFPKCSEVKNPGCFKSAKQYNTDVGPQGATAFEGEFKLAAAAWTNSRTFSRWPISASQRVVDDGLPSAAIEAHGRALSKKN